MLFIQGKTDGITNKENQQPTSLRNLVNGWNEPSLLNKKSTSGLNLRQQKDSPFNEVKFSENVFFYVEISYRIVTLLLRNLKLF